MRLIQSLAVKFLKGHWGRIIPAVFKSAAEGSFGPQVKAVYWFGEKYATVTGAVMWGLGAAMETVCNGYPQYTWTCKAMPIIVSVGQVLTSVGLLRGAVNSPWPEGAQKDRDK
jgi:hypothetical protein